MITERAVHADLKAALVANTPIQYAHLIKFERPSRVDANGRTSTSKERYTYLTDASRDVNFDDGSTNLAGVPNGTQVYLANKVLKVSNVSEQTEARANNFSLILDGNGIGAFAQAVVTVSVVSAGLVWDIAFPATIDLLRYGFREGDKVTLSCSAFTADVNVNSFRGQSLRVTKIDEAISAFSGAMSISLSSEEIKSILLDKNSTGYASFVNREVFVYRAFFQGGTIVGAPVLLFKGIISNVAFDEGDNGIQVSWGLTSHWGDFAQVKGRITSDDFHRALDQNGVPQPQSALKLAYAYDKGFSHAETSVNLLASYSVAVEKQDIKTKKGFLGIGAKVKVKSYTVQETRNTDLDIQLQAKSIPVIYGVRVVQGIPIFADTLKDNSSIVYVAYALSEGEIGGIYDVYVNGNSLICNDKADFDARSVQTPDNTVELICRGRADRGDVLGGSTSVSTSTVLDFYVNDPYLYNFDDSFVNLTQYQQYVPPVTTTPEYTGAGVIHGQSIKLTSPQEITLDVFSGKSGQKASSQLVDIAKNKNFKVQNDYWLGTDTAEYWSPNHRLLDTAYVVARVVLAEGETTIPSLEFIIRGKAVNCYNYDYSYSHDGRYAEQSADNFPLGSLVTLHNSAGTAITASLQIIDKWTFANPDGSLNTRFRFSSPPPLGYVEGVPSIKSFSMRNAGGDSWNMITYNYEEFGGTIQTAQATPLISFAETDGFLAFTYDKNTFGGERGGDPTENGIPSIGFIKADGSLYTDNNLLSSDRTFIGSDSTSWSQHTYITKVPYNNDYATAAAKAVADGVWVYVKNTITLPSSASADDDVYNSYIIRLYRYNASNDKQLVQERKIIKYTGSTRTVTVDEPWDPEFYPKIGDTVSISPSYADIRCSINPAIQTLDYMTSVTYGKGLDVNVDLYLPSWLESGRICDTQSNVTVLLSGTSTIPTQGQIFRYPTTGDIIWQGEVVGNEGRYVEFTNVIGKLTNAWNSWKEWKAKELVHVEDRLYVSTGGLITTKPTHNSGTINGLTYLESSNSPILAGADGSTYLTTVVDGNPVRALRNGSRIPGYSLYDSDSVDYFRLIGWDEQTQRYVTRHQTNLAIDTSQSLFDNNNSLLEHFGGILRYSSGKYYLEVEEPEYVISTEETEVRNITTDHIIGKIKLSDEGVKSAYNSLTASYPDPANKFEARNISFFNSDYLKADRNVPKKGSVSVPGITNYYNTRILADKYLSKSRFGLTISFNMRPLGLLLLAGKVIQIQYPKYGWIDKKFRISTLTHQEDATVDVVAEEYDDSFYVLSKISKQAGSGLGSNANLTSIASPTGLRATSIDNGDEAFSSVQITWVNNPTANTKNVYTELYSSYSSKLYISVDSITGNVLSCTTAHGLKQGELITSQVTINGLEIGKSYFVKEIVSTTQFTLSETKDGSVKGLINGSSVGAIMLTATLIATLPVPTNSFMDSVGGLNGRVIKYYWVRHKVIQES